jgi:tetratricopeptide (TPR) repeat protein
MSLLLLVVFNAVFANGQTPGWEKLTRLAIERQEADDLAAAERLRREALRDAEEKLGPEDTLIASLLANVAQSLHLEGRDAEADPLLRRALLIAEQSGDLKLKGKVLNTLGIVLAGEGNRARAEPVLRRSVALLEEAEGKDSLDVAKALNNLATIYTDTRQYAKAELEMRRALPIFEKHLGADDPMVAMVSGNVFTILNAQHRVNEGEPYLRHALAIGEKAFPQTLKMANLELCLAALEAGRGNLKEAARLLEKVIAMQERLLGPEHPDLAQSLIGYSTVLRSLHQKSEAKIVQNRANLILKSALSDVK